MHDVLRFLRLFREEQVGVATVLLLWGGLQVLLWPAALTFRDEVGYVGQARLVLDGTFHPQPASVCWSFPVGGTHIAAYPFAVPLLLAPLLALAPRAVFVFGLVSAVVLVLEAAALLTRWRRPPVLACLMLAHPTVALLSRTAMVDVALAAAGLAAWRASMDGSRTRALVAFASLGLLKPTGFVVAAGLLVGLGLARSDLRRGGAGAVLGMVLGLGGVAALNWAATGGPSYAYAKDFVHFGLVPISILHLIALLILPPGLLLVGAWGLWRRAAWPALVASLLLISFLTFYGFADRGRSLGESLVLASRLTLPAVAMLLVAYLDVVWGWIPAGSRSAVFFRRWGVAAVVLGVTAFVATHHRAGQEPMRRAREAAEQAMHAAGAGELGLTSSTFKTGLLRRGPVSFVPAGSTTHAVILCSTWTESYRDRQVSSECSFPGYAVAKSIGDYRVLRRASPP